MFGDAVTKTTALTKDEQALWPHSLSSRKILAVARRTTVVSDYGVTILSQQHRARTELTIIAAAQAFRRKASGHEDVYRTEEADPELHVFVLTHLDSIAILSIIGGTLPPHALAWNVDDA